MAPVHDEQWREVKKMRIAEAFALFDKDKKGIFGTRSSLCVVFSTIHGRICVGLVDSFTTTAQLYPCIKYVQYLSFYCPSAVYRYFLQNWAIGWGMTSSCSLVPAVGFGSGGAYDASRASTYNLRIQCS